MARKIVWSASAECDKNRILEYWVENNKSTAYSIRLDKIFHRVTKLLSRRPFIGRRTSIENIRAKLIRDYWMFYQIHPDRIDILVIWDTRQNPDKIPYK